MATRPISPRRLFCFRVSTLFVSLLFAYVVAEIVFRLYRYNHLLNHYVKQVAVSSSGKADSVLKMAWQGDEEFKRLGDFHIKLHEACVYDPDIGFRLLPDIQFDESPPKVTRRKWKTNQHGHVSDDDYTVAKPASEYRIITIGDSYTHGVNNGVRWQDLLQAGLNRHAGWKNFVKGKFTRVINLGLDGIGIGQYKAVYDFEGKKFDPDLTILDFITNDIGRRWYSMGLVRTPADLEDHVYKNILGRLDWYRIYPELLASTSLGQELGLQYHLDPQTTRYYQDMEESVKVCVAAIRHIERQCPKILLVHHPVFKEMTNIKRSLSPAVNPVLGKLAAALGDTKIWHMAHYLAKLKKEGESYDSWYQNPYDIHHSDLGQEVFAVALENLLIEQFAGGPPNN